MVGLLRQSHPKQNLLDVKTSVLDCQIWSDYAYYGLWLEEGFVYNLYQGKLQHTANELQLKGGGQGCGLKVH